MQVSERPDSYIAKHNYPRQLERRKQGWKASFGTHKFFTNTEREIEDLWRDIPVDYYSHSNKLQRGLGMV
jgi:hypothetical protein